LLALACTCCAVLIAQPAAVASASGSLVLRDGFSGTAINSRIWHIPTWNSSTDGTYVGRTQFRVSQHSPLPSVSKGCARITVQTYNPTGHSFYGTDLISNRSFTVGNGVDISVRARMDAPAQRGIVGGIFLYDLKRGSNTLHDEIDFELLGNEPTKVHTNIYADEPLGVGNPSAASYLSGSATGYHLYEIKWLPTRVSWYVDGHLVRTATSHIPTGPMHVHLNMWAPDSDWPGAYYSGIQPTESSRANKVFTMSIDSVVVILIKPAKSLSRHAPG
jgi:beta-glucanase (GH16 family)